MASFRVLLTAGLSLLTLGATVLPLLADTPAATIWPTAPPQAQGLPYTRSAHKVGLAQIADCVAVYAGSRYAYVHGDRVRLDDSTPETMLHSEAVLRDGLVYVPTAFLGVLHLKNVAPQPAPRYLADRWVYTLDLPQSHVPPGVATLAVNDLTGPDLTYADQTYVDLAGAAAALGLHTARTADGLLLIGAKVPDPASWSVTTSDDVITLFDTPDKLADPDIATEYVPLLKKQGKWTDHVHVTPAELKLLDGPETKWPFVPRSEYDLTGFNAALLGSPVPPPGVYPRLLFSPRDVPVIYARMRASAAGQKNLITWDVLFHKTWWDPTTDDGKVFLKLSSGDTADLKWPDAPLGTPSFMVTHDRFQGYKPGLFTPHLSYVTSCLTSMALYCLLTGDDVHGQMAADALVNYYKMIEPMVLDLDATSDSETGVNPDEANYSQTGWRGMHGVVAHMDLPFALDFGGHWMTAAQKDFLRRFIAEATYGRRDNMAAAPARVKDVNHVTWHLTDYLAVAAIEGLPGCDPEELEAGRETARAFLDWGIDRNGQMFESNGKSGGGFQFQALTMIALARRGDNLWGHPHLRRLLTAQTYVTSPNGQATLSSGTYGASPFSGLVADEVKAFYPGEKAADYLLDQQYPDIHWATFDAQAYRAQLEHSISRVLLPGPHTIGAVATTCLYDADWARTTRESLGLPLTWNDPVYGLLSAATDRTPDASWLCLHVRQNQYIGAGHHHADVGMFYFSGDGVNWVTETPFVLTYDGKYHSEVLIDGLAEPDGLPGRGTYLGASLSPLTAFGSLDQTQSYTYRWVNQVILWDDQGEGAPWSGVGRSQWTLATDPYTLTVYRGTQRDKSRPWWPSYDFSNWIPVVQTPYNPVRYAYRTAGLVRGPHPYGVVVDDIQKDDANHLYQWAAMMGAGVGLAPITPRSASEIVLARQSDIVAGAVPNGAPLLLVYAVSHGGSLVCSAEMNTPGPPDRQGKPQTYARVLAGMQAPEAHYRVLMIPYHQGDVLPTLTYDATQDVLRAQWPDQSDTFTFAAGADHRTRFTLTRGGATIGQVR